jgi:hypothetical protein
MFTAGAIVKGGFYFNRDRPDLVAVGGKEGALPGAEGERYFRVPALAVLPLAPVLGALFVVLLPLVGLLLVLRPLGRPALAGAGWAGHGLRFIGTPIWRRGEAYFARQRGGKPAAEDAKHTTDAKDESPSAGPDT